MSLTHRHELDPNDICSPGVPCALCLADPNRPTTAVISDNTAAPGSQGVICTHADPPPPAPVGGTPPTAGGTPPTAGGTPPAPGGTPPTAGGTPPPPPPPAGGTSTGKVVAIVVVVVAVAVAIALALSDRRVKRDIQLVRRRPDGIGIYRYRYLWGDEYYVGVMAQEVAEIVPSAVVRTNDGYLRVDYAQLGMDLMRENDGAEVERPAHLHAQQEVDVLVDGRLRVLL